MNLQLTLFLSALWVTPILLSPVAAQAVPSKPLGQRGVYGSSSLDAENPSGAAPAEEDLEERQETPEEAELRKKLEARYPLSITSLTRNSQAAHQAFLAGLQSYHLSKSMFEAASGIKSTYDQKLYLLKVEQQGVLQSRLQPQDILQYGPDYAYVALKIRALQEAQTQISVSVSQFSKAVSLSPRSRYLKEWLRIAKDTLKVFKYHIRFYQLSLQNLRRGLDKERLEQLASRWNTGNPPEIKPGDTMRTTVYLGPSGNLLGQKAAGKTTGKDAPALDTMDQFLPSVNFSVK
jgi:hypothetical protein